MGRKERKGRTEAQWMARKMGDRKEKEERGKAGPARPVWTTLIHLKAPKSKNIELHKNLIMITILFKSTPKS